MYYIGAGLFLMMVLYFWITPVLPYSGVVEEKYTRSAARKWNRITYYVVVGGKARPVSRNVYDNVAKGDTISHPMAQQRYYINGSGYAAEEYAWNTAFWAGMLFVCCLMLCAGAYYRCFAKRPSGHSCGKDH